MVLLLNCRYMESNVRALDTIRAYDRCVPRFLHNRPRSFIDHCLQRLPPGVDRITSDDIQFISDKTYFVRSGQKQYTVTLLSPVPSCGCVDWERHFKPCKHMLAVLQFAGWDLLPLEYSEFSLFVLDPDVVSYTSPSYVNTSERLDDADVSAPHVNTGASDSQAEANDVSAVGDEILFPSASQSHFGQRDAAYRPLTEDAVKQQSRVRQCLSILSSYTYSLLDTNLLNEMTVTLQGLIRTCKQTVTLVPKKFKNRKRIGKRNTVGSALYHRLRSIRGKKRLKKLLCKQRKRKCHGLYYSCTVNQFFLGVTDSVTSFIAWFLLLFICIDSVEIGVSYLVRLKRS